MNNVGIVWIKLDEESKKTLLSVVGQAYEKLYNDHVTLVFKVLEADYAETIGKTVVFVATQEAKNGEIQAVKVSLPGWVPCKNNEPHITISAKEGVPPNNSNAMIESKTFEARDLGEGVEISGKIEFFEFKPRV